MPDFVLLIVGALVPIAALMLAFASGGARAADVDDDDAAASAVPLAGES